ncbi:MAG: DUF3343 domain-containing protein [Ruminococcaceae bacterium]|nr:DUF3343 domain-containing protein [Oscillospiraceae bacterium]
MQIHTPSYRHCVAAIGGMTGAVKARHALLSASISSEIVALSPQETRKGCAYGVEFPCESYHAVREILRHARITVSEYLER